MAGGWAATAARADADRAGLQPCTLPAVAHAAWCGSLRRPLDPAAPHGVQIEIHYAVLPALARERRPDPVFLLAGGPGQSAIDLAPLALRTLGRLNNRRDVVLVDQRGTGRSAPLPCPETPPTAPLAQTLDPAASAARLRACLQALQRTPAGVLRHYATWVAVQDIDAVRQALAAPRINLVGGSYGTRAALEYQRQFPQRVRRAVLDGLAPPDMALPAAAAADTAAAMSQVWSACEADRSCSARYPRLQADWERLLAQPPRQAAVQHPLTGETERVVIDAATVRSLARAALYVPALAAGLPAAIDAAARDRWEPLTGLAAAAQGRQGNRFYEGMHFAVVCAEDGAPSWSMAGSDTRSSAGAPGPAAAEPEAGTATSRPASAVQPARPTGGPAPATPASARSEPGDEAFSRVYREVCPALPPAAVPAAFYRVGPASAPTLLFSGGADPATPPRHAQRVAAALGERARHVVVSQAGHGVLSVPCLRDVIFRFIDASTDEQARAVDAGCAREVPRPRVFLPPIDASAAASGPRAGQEPPR